ncbi:hypothetical protein [Nocardia salmonicida]|uniref:hypothetical protein n=1 Tax=Nocardia salmonicida TaxID=53431 RepID=UPI00379628BA
MTRARKKNGAETPAKEGGLGTAVLSDERRSRLEMRAASNNPLAAFPARVRLHIDTNRRIAAGMRENGIIGKDARELVRISKSGVIGPGGGRSRSVGSPVEFRGTTAQVCGIWPWAVGAGAPLIGTPLGGHLTTGEPVCFDPMNWFTRGGFITAPILFILGLNGYGKSSLVRRLILGDIAQGVIPLILADVKPDYRSTVEMVGGQVIDLGYGHGKLNPLDAGVMAHALAKLEAAELEVEAQSLRTELRARQTNLIAGLVEIIRGQRIADFEDTLISTSLQILFRPTDKGGRGFTPSNPPILDDLAAVIAGGGTELHLDAAAEDAAQYAAATIPLRRSLRALTQGNFGAVFNGQTTTPLDLDSVAICVDVSHIAKSDRKLKAAVMMTSWNSGFGSIEALNMLADAGLGRQKFFSIVMDELWQALGLGDFMVDRVDELTRLQRGVATALYMISHTIKDLQSLASAAAMSKALGFLERARAKIFGALPREEIARLSSIVPFTATETNEVTSWSAPQALTGEPLKRNAPKPLAAGVGKFLLKVGEDGSPGIPFQLELTEVERQAGIHETSKRFDTFGDRDDDDFDDV